MFRSLILIAALFSMFFNVARAQGMPGVVMSNGEMVGMAMVGETCLADQKSCISVLNDGRLPMEIVVISYSGPAGGVYLEAVPVLDGGRMQCILPSDGRACAPVLAPGQRAAVDLSQPLAPGGLITVRLRQWDPPGKEPGSGPLPQGPWAIGGIAVTLIGDRAAASQAPALPAEEREGTVGQVSNFVSWGKFRQ